eukprot:gene9563-biopygen354
MMRWNGNQEDDDFFTRDGGNRRRTKAQPAAGSRDKKGRRKEKKKRRRRSTSSSSSDSESSGSAPADPRGAAAAPTAQQQQAAASVLAQQHAALLQQQGFGAFGFAAGMHPKKGQFGRPPRPSRSAARCARAYSSAESPARPRQSCDEWLRNCQGLCVRRGGSISQRGRGRRVLVRVSWRAHARPSIIHVDAIMRGRPHPLPLSNPSSIHTGLYAGAGLLGHPGRCTCKPVHTSEPPESPD